MDRRQLKTRAAIFQAFRELLMTKKYENITVQEIINEANIGRSTFYAHFETKDDLLFSMCEDIFRHVFIRDPYNEDKCNFVGEANSLQIKLAHTLYHLQENKNNLSGLIGNDCNPVFIKFFKEYLEELFNNYLNSFNVNVPKDFLLNHLVGSFAETVKWWFAEDTKHSPEEMAEFFMLVVNTDAK